MNNIILIGMPGAGKSTIGVVLAKHLGYHFLDSDLLIQEKEHRLLHEILEQDGLDYFNRIENEVNASIQTSRTVIATGGSVVYGAEAMAHLKSLGTIVYLQLPEDELALRLGDFHQRGIAMKHGQALTSLYHERTPLYEKYADITLHCARYSIQECVHQIAQSIPR